MKNCFKIIIAVAIILISNPLRAQNFNDALLLSEPGLYTGARALSLGNSYTALSNDFSGVLFNPAGLGFINKLQISTGFNLNSFDNQTTFFNTTTGAERTSINLNQFGIIYPIPTVKGSWIFAIGYNRVKEFNRTLEFAGFNGSNNSMIRVLTGEVNDEIPITNDLGLAFEIRDPQTDLYIKDTTLINGMLNQSGRIRKQGSLGNWSFSSSMEIAKGLMLGGTFNILTGTYKSDSDYWEDDTQDIYGVNVELIPGDPATKDFQAFYINDIIEWELSGWDAKVGILYNWVDLIKFGATVKFPSFYTVKETFFVDSWSEFGTGAGYELNPKIVDNIQYEIKTPYEYTFGAAVNYWPVTVSADVKLIDYTSMEFTKGFSTEYRIARNREIEDLFTTTINYNIGAEVKIPSLPVWGRIGAMFLQSPFVNDPAKFDKKYFTLGAGIELGGLFKIDAAYAFGWWEDFGDNYGVNESRTFQDINVHKVILNISTQL